MRKLGLFAVVLAASLFFWSAIGNLLPHIKGKQQPINMQFSKSDGLDKPALMPIKPTDVLRW